MSARLTVPIAVVVGGLLAATWQPSASPAPSGFVTDRADAHATLERRFLDLPNADRLRDTHRYLTDEPHVAGSARDRVLAEWTRDRFRDLGFDEVSLVRHDVLLPYPLEVRVEMIEPARWVATMREDRIAGDSSKPADDLGTPYHAYSASGEVTAPVVFAGSGEPSDYDWLSAQGIDLKGKIALVRNSVPYSYRGFKVLTAERRGLAGILIYSDPQDDGDGKGAVYPHGPWGPDSHIQRGSVAYDFLVPGDPLTPGWASVDGAPRLAARDAVTLPSILSAPLSARDAREILSRLDGPEVPPGWRGGPPLTYRAGSTSTVLRMRVRSDDKVRPVWTVTAMLRGAERPDEVVVLGNHRDAWTYGGVDPSSGSAVLMELARSLSELKRGGWRPRRSILLASWDAEEFSLISSTEWAEQHREWLTRGAVAYLNVDSAASGQALAIAAVPALNDAIESAAGVLRDPASRLTLLALARDRASRERGTGGLNAAPSIVDNRIGGGSDFTPFLNHLGVPVADFSFRGPYGVYHSRYDTHDWVARFGDPGFQYHVVLAQLWGLVTIRLADADIVPLDYAPYASAILDYLREVRTRWTSGQLSTPDGDPMKDAIAAAIELRDAANQFNARREAALAANDIREALALNAQLLTVERALLDPDGLPGRPWYRHVVYAPRFSYAPEILPGVAEALTAGEIDRARTQAQRLTEALRRASMVLLPQRTIPATP